MKATDGHEDARGNATAGTRGTARPVIRLNSLGRSTLIDRQCGYHRTHATLAVRALRNSWHSANDPNGLASSV